MFLELKNTTFQSITIKFGLFNTFRFPFDKIHYFLKIFIFVKLSLEPQQIGKYSGARQRPRNNFDDLDTLS